MFLFWCERKNNRCSKIMDLSKKAWSCKWKRQNYNGMLGLDTGSFTQELLTSFLSTPGGDAVCMFISIYRSTHKKMRKLNEHLKSPGRQTTLRVARCLIWWVVRTERKSMVIHGIECPHWDQMSLNNTMLWFNLLQWHCISNTLSMILQYRRYTQPFKGLFVNLLLKFSLSLSLSKLSSYSVHTLPIRQHSRTK